MKKRLFSLVLCLVMVFSLLPTFAAAEGERVLVDQNTSDPQNGDLHMTKTLYRNSDGTYDIAIESWATGVVDSQVVTKAIPTDFVLVLDQSGSMTERDMPAAYTPVAGPWSPNRLSNYGQTLYYKVTNADGTTSYHQAYWKDIPTGGLTQITGSRVKDYGKNTVEGIAVNYNGRAVYYRDSDGAIYRVYRDTYNILRIYNNSSFYYYDSTGARKDIESRTWWGAGLLTNSQLTSQNLYTVNDNSHRYSLYYKDAAGVEHQVEGSSTVSGAGDTFYSGELYRTTGQNQTRLEALKNAVSGFVSTVEAKAAEDGVNHRIAIVGFASDNSQNTTQNPAWENTELLTGVNVSGTNGCQYNLISDTDYRNALQNVTTGAGQTDLDKAVNAIAAKGGTQAQYGFYMAENILEKRTETTYVNEAGQTADRNTVVLFFTDGHPGNYDTDDTIAAANTVVDAATSVKQNKWNTKVFSVGIFASGDDQPLTFALNSSNMSNRQYEDAIARDNYIRYSGGYLYFRGNKVTQTPYNDTIADYMTCVSSKYPGASNFLTHTGGTADTGAKTNSRGAENQDHVDYYMRVTDASGLQKAFETIANSIDTSSTSATVNGDAVLRDTVYLEDFDVSGASVEPKSVQVEMVDGQVVETGAAGTAKPTVTESVSTNGRLSVTGFDYSGLYTAANRPGEKLVVTIHNVEPKQGGHLWSNSGDASIYPGPNSTDAVLGVSSPEENVARVTKVIDFNAPMIISDGMNRWKAVGTIRNGEYDVDAAGNFTYQLNSGNQASKDAVINTAYFSADSAMVYGNKVYDRDTEAFVDRAGWTQVTTVPASSVYYDDDLTGQAVNVGEGYGYNSGFDANKAKTTFDGSGRIFFTFYGTGIDVYCTTDSESGIVSAAVYEVGETEYNGQTIPVGAKVQGPISVRNYSGDAVRYNTPTVSFRDLTANSYTIMLSANEAAKIKIDGVRVYNPVEAGTAAATELSNTDEADALYVNLHSLLLNGAKDSFSVTKPEDMDAAFDKSTISGVLFVDDAKSICTESHWYKNEGETEDTWHDETQPVYQTQFDAYKTNSPNNEIYLDGPKAAVEADPENEIEAQEAKGGQAITFQVNTQKAPAGSTIYIGLSAPDNGSGSGSVTVTGRTNPETGELDPLPVTSVMDMYYPIEVPANGVITIANVGDSMIAITNLKITHVPGAKGINAMPANEKLGAMRAFFMPVTTETVELAAESMSAPETTVVPDTPATPDTPDQPDDPKPGWSDGADTIQVILSQLFQMLLKSLSGLFSGLGNW